MSGVSGIELDLGGGLKLAHSLKKGYTGYFEGREFHVLREGTVIESFSGSQGKILNQLIQKSAMTPKQLSDAVGATPAAVIYNLKPLIDAGVVERHPLPGGTVFYVLCWEVKMDLSPTIKAKVESAVSSLGGWSELPKIPMGDLRAKLSGLSEDEFIEVMRYLVGGTGAGS